MREEVEAERELKKSSEDEEVERVWMTELK